MKPEDRKKAILMLADWAKRENLPSIRSFPLKSKVDIERMVGRARSQFQVSRDAAVDLTDSAFGVAHDRWVRKTRNER